MSPRTTTSCCSCAPRKAPGAPRVVEGSDSWPGGRRTDDAPTQTSRDGRHGAWPLKKARLTLSSVDRRALALLGVQDGAELKVPVDLTVDAQNVDDHLEVSARVRAGGRRKTAAIDLFATADDKAYDATVSIAPTELSSIAGILPVLAVQASSAPTRRPPTRRPTRSRSSGAR